jgi:hypothetical protein
MESDGRAALAERFERRIKVLRERIEMLEKLILPPKAPAPTGLLRLPIEIRLQIYYHCIPRKRIIEVVHPRFVPQYPFDSEDGSDYWDLNRNRNSIFRLSKQISEEALDVLYGDNIFKLYLHGEGEHQLMRNFSHRNRQRMRYLLLIAQPRSFLYTPENRVEEALWRSILPHLKGLRIVAEQPVEEGTYYGAPTHKQEMDCWINWFSRYMQCFGQYLVKETKIEVDTNDQAETEELVKKCLLYGYRKIRCYVAGDFIFKRGRYSWESGYWDDDGPMNSRDADGDWGSD